MDVFMSFNGAFRKFIKVLPDTISDAAKWIAFNQKYIGFWPNISERDDLTADADDRADVPDKMAHLLKNLVQQ